MMKNKTLKITMLALCLIAFGHVEAQTRLKNDITLFNRIDTNCDQRISLREYNRYRVKTRTPREKRLRKRDFSNPFYRMDLNRNGFVGKREFLARIR